MDRGKVHKVQSQGMMFTDNVTPDDNFNCEADYDYQLSPEQKIANEEVMAITAEWVKRLKARGEVILDEALPCVFKPLNRVNN
ncbi:hypothetical protein J6590_042871 [Homalodisca vitripennis]|nr:hypothetical protein J6590_042871 [Homalodisca vitripennis]